MQRLVPIGDESCQFRRFVLQIFGYGIIERTDIGVLFLYPFHFKENEELFQQFVQRQQTPFLQLLSKGLRQVVFYPVQQNGVQINILFQNVMLVSHSQTGTGDAVVRIGQIAQAVYQHTYRRRGIHAESLVGYNMIRCILVEIVCNERNQVILSDQNGNLILTDTALYQFIHLLA